ncbi:MAG: DNA-processing protein DprA [Mesorhizobium sp.]
MANLNGNRRTRRYIPPLQVKSIRLNDLLIYCERSLDSDQRSLFKGLSDADMDVFYAGDLALLKRPCISVIGARNVSERGAARARNVARGLVENGFVVTSGLAKGVDAEAHRATLNEGGDTIAVIGTPLDKAYPIENADMQMDIYSNHLLVSQFRPGERTFPSDFPKRNRLMAALTDASVIIEASDSSGTLHQAVECVNLGRWLFIANSVIEDDRLEWPKKFAKYDRCVALKDISDITSRL